MYNLKFMENDTLHVSSNIKLHVMVKNQLWFEQTNLFGFFPFLPPKNLDYSCLNT